MIIATAGHVDHGKTLLVKALTGVDADRLPEEKKRGMTIDLGFAYLPVASAETIGFVDVPGHERFVHNMLAGVAGIDFVLFLVAADDGPKPQTREHLAILDLLGMSRGAIAITKIDRVSRERVVEVKQEVTALLSSTTLAGAPVFPLSALTGEGVVELKTYLETAAHSTRPRPTNSNFRLAIDRCFSMTGAGLIVTGTAFSGSVSTGDTVRVLGPDVEVRVRTIHAQNAASNMGRAGQRCALNLSGPGLRDGLIARGDWIVNGDVPAPVQKFDARLRVLASEVHPLVHWTPVHVHAGAASTTGHVAVLNGLNIAAGASSLVQLVLDRPLGVLHGDGLILRDQSAQRTIAGGKVIDIFPPARGRAKAERLQYLQRMEKTDHDAALASLLEQSPVNLTRFAQCRNLTIEQSNALITRAVIKCIPTSLGTLGFQKQHWMKLTSRVLETLTLLHGRAPGSVPSSTSVFQHAGLRVVPEVAAALVAELIAENAIVREPNGIRLRTHVAQLAPADAAFWKKVQALIHATPLKPPTVHEIAQALQLDPKVTESFLVRVSRLGLLTRVTDNRFFPPEALRQHAAFMLEVAAANGGRITAGKLRDRAGIGRVLAIEILEYFDRIKFTRRVGDEHLLLRPIDPANSLQSRVEEQRTPVGRPDFKSGERR